MCRKAVGVSIESDNQKTADKQTNSAIRYWHDKRKGQSDIFLVKIAIAIKIKIEKEGSHTLKNLRHEKEDPSL